MIYRYFLLNVLRVILAKASELLTSAEHKAAAAADVIATKAVEAKNTTVAAAQSAASTVQGSLTLIPLHYSS